METKGTKLRFSSRVPTMEELESIPKSYRIHLTGPRPWNSSTVTLSQVECKNQREFETNDNEDTNSKKRASVIAELAPDGDHVLLSSISYEIVDMQERLSNNVRISIVDKKRTINEVYNAGDKPQDDIPALEELLYQQIGILKPQKKNWLKHGVSGQRKLRQP